MIYIGIDPAATTGIAIIEYATFQCFDLKPRIKSTEFVEKGIDIFKQIKDVLPISSACKIGIENFTYFAKSKTTQLRLTCLLGYIYYTLYQQGYDIIPVHTGSARKYLGTKNKILTHEYLSTLYNVKFTKDQTDALAIALFLAKDCININDIKYQTKD